MGIAQQLATFVCGAEIGDLPASDREILHRHLADVVVARIAGRMTHEGRAVATLYPRSTGVHAIAGIAGSVRLTEIDDIHIESCTTPSAVTVPVALGLVAGDQNIAPDRFASAIWAGTELVVRLGKAISGASILYQGVWPTRAGAALGAAATASRMWRLDEEATAHALAFAVMLTNGRSGRFAGEPSGRWVLFAETISAGLRAAEAAREGFKSDLAALEGAWLERSLGVPVDIAKLTTGLGETSVFPELSLKPICTSRQALSPTAAMREAMADGLDPSSVRSIRVRVPTAYSGMISMQLDPAQRGSSYVSAGAQLALAALAPDHLYDVARDMVLANPAIQQFADLVSVEADPALDAMFPNKWPARIEIETRDGTIIKRVEDAPGDPKRRLDDAALQAKWEAVLSHLGRSGSASQLMLLSHGAMREATAVRTLAAVFQADGLPDP